MKFHKQEEQGVGKVCRVWEQYGDERAAEAKQIGILEGKQEGIKEGKLVGLKEGKLVGLKEGENTGKQKMAISLLKDGTLSVQKIAEISGFSVEQLQMMVDEISR